MVYIIKRIDKVGYTAVRLKGGVDVSSVSPSSERITNCGLRTIYIGKLGATTERNDKDASKPVARHFNLPNHSTQNMAICGLSLHQGNTESRKNLEEKFIFQPGFLKHTECHSSNLFTSIHTLLWFHK